MQSMFPKMGFTRNNKIDTPSDYWENKDYELRIP